MKLVIGLTVATLVAVTYAIEPVFDLPHRGCYFTNWAQYRAGVASYKAANLDPTLCTYISVAFGNIVDNVLTPLEWNDLTTFASLVAYKQTVPNLKIFLSVGGWTLTSQLVAISATDAARNAFVSSVVTNLRAWGLDGLDVDWEFPLAADKTSYSTLLTALRAAFVAEAAQSGNPRLALSVALHLVSDGGFDGAVINNTVDIANVMTYDLAGAWDLTGTAHQAPLFLGPQGVASDLNVASIMQTWVSAGVSKSKLVIGLPLYGRGWMLASAASHGLGAPVSAAITTSVYTQESGSWPYYEICQHIQSDLATNVFDTNIQAAYAYNGSWWIGYDDVQTITAKTVYAKTNGYGGVYVWDTAQDDFANLCGLGANPLMRAIKAASAGTSTTASAPTTKLTTTRTSTTTATTAKVTATRATKATITTAAAPKPTTAKTATVSTTQTTTTATATAVCGTTLCNKNGPGLAALGPCSSIYCNCDSVGNGYLGSCGSALVYDPTLQYCNYNRSVAGCQQSGR